MITLLGSLFGFLGATIPELFNFFKDRSDKSHEIELLQLQLKQQETANAAHLEEVRIGSDSAEMQALYKTYATGVAWVDALNGSVRPVLAYAFFLLYAVTKFLQILLVKELTMAMLPILWGEEDQAIFAGIISFYFGHRAFQKMRK